MIFWFLFVLLSIANALPELETGDIIAHTSTSSQSKLIQIGTTSKYSHIGVVVFRENKPFVIEAISTVQYTPLRKFIDRGKGGKYTILRYKDKERGGLTPQEKNKLRQAIPKYQGKGYDLAFRWSNEKQYCSELVWKLYQDVGITLNPTRKMKDF